MATPFSLQRKKKRSSSDKKGTRTTRDNGDAHSASELPVISEASDANNNKRDKSSRSKDGNRRGGVQFRSQHSIKQIRRVSHVSDYSAEEINNYWCDSKDQIKSMSDFKKAVKDMHVHRRTSDINFTTLGIEEYAGKAKANKKANTLLSRNAVMEEQDLQYYEGIVDDELLADVYTITSKTAKEDAKKKAERLHRDLAT